MLLFMALRPSPIFTRFWLLISGGEVEGPQEGGWGSCPGKVERTSGATALTMLIVTGTLMEPKKAIIAKGLGAAQSSKEKKRRLMKRAGHKDGHKQSLA